MALGAMAEHFIGQTEAFRMGWNGNDKRLREWYPGDETTTFNETYRGEDNDSDDDAYAASKRTRKDTAMNDKEDQSEASESGPRKAQNASGPEGRPLTVGPLGGGANESVLSAVRSQ